MFLSDFEIPNHNVDKLKNYIHEETMHQSKCTNPANNFIIQKYYMHK